jgi:hypothetical protein
VLSSAISSSNLNTFIECFTGGRCSCEDEIVLMHKSLNDSNFYDLASINRRTPGASCLMLRFICTSNESASLVLQICAGEVTDVDSASAELYYWMHLVKNNYKEYNLLTQI